MKKKICIAVDTDNINPAIITPLMQEVNKYGYAAIKNLYGTNFCRSLAWKEIAESYGFDSKHTFAHTTAKNSADIALTADVIDLAYSCQLDGILIVSNDGDFTCLAHKIRRVGLEVYGAGERAPECFRAACDHFIDTNFFTTLASTGMATEDVVASALTRIVETSLVKGSWVPMCLIGAQIRRQIPEFKASQYGYRNLSELLKSTGRFNVQERKNEKGIPEMFVGLSDAVKVTSRDRN